MYVSMFGPMLVDANKSGLARMLVIGEGLAARGY